jgi:ABC-type antimicrobial peptide transport system permease subunit
MAIRAALGASRASITGLVLRRRLVLTLAGSAGGALASVAVGRAIESQLYEVAP